MTPTEALRLAIRALNDVPTKRTTIPHPTIAGRCLTTYELLPILEAAAKEPEPCYDRDEDSEL